MKGDDLDGNNVNEKLRQYHSLIEMKDKDFPAFFSLRSLIMMIDASMIYPFFARTYDNQI
jgi:hypothetical protein